VTCSSKLLGGPGAPERGCILEHQIFRFAEMILRDRCNTSYDLASPRRGRRSTLDTWTGKIAKSIGTRLSALHSTFQFLKEVSQNCFVFDVATSKMRKCLRIASFLMLSTLKTEEVSQNSFVFKLADRQIDRATARWMDGWIDR